MEQPSLEILIAADARQFPIGKVNIVNGTGINIVRAGGGGVYIPKTDETKHLKVSDVIFYKNLKPGFKSKAAFARQATEAEAAAYKRFEESRKLSVPDSRTHFDRLY